MRFRFVAITLLLLGCGSSQLLNSADSINESCRKDPRVIGNCRTVHGRLSNWNGNPTRRVWIIGTKRMLGVRDGTPLPAVLEDRIGDFDDEVYGDFEFCPFTRERPGVMQVGCIAGVSNYTIRRRKQ